MKQPSNRTSKMLIAAASGLLSLTSVNALANDFYESKGAVQALTGYDVNETSFLKKHGIEIGRAHV